MARKCVLLMVVFTQTVAEVGKRVMSGQCQILELIQSHSEFTFCVVQLSIAEIWSFNDLNPPPRATIPETPGTSSLLSHPACGKNCVIVGLVAEVKDGQQMMTSKGSGRQQDANREVYAGRQLSERKNSWTAPKC